MSRRLYVYYRVPADALAEAVSAVRAMQAGLRAARPGWHTDLLRRPFGAGDADVTLMETYSAAGGIDADGQRAIAAAAADLPGAAGRAARHVEVFEPCD